MKVVTLLINYRLSRLVAIYQHYICCQLVICFIHPGVVTQIGVFQLSFDIISGLYNVFTSIQGLVINQPLPFWIYFRKQIIFWAMRENAHTYMCTYVCALSFIALKGDCTCSWNPSTRSKQAFLHTYSSTHPPSQRRIYASVNCVSIGSDNGLPRIRAKPLSKPMLDYCQLDH